MTLIEEKIPAFVINLKKDKHKKAHMLETAKQAGFKLTFIEAVYGKDLSEEKVSSVCNHDKSIEVIGRKLFRGEVGVALSQMSIYKKMIEENIQVAMIFEDDIVIDKSLHEVVSSIDNFPKTWELVLLGYHRIFISNKFHRISFRMKKLVSKNFKTVRFTDKMDGAFGYLINLEGAKRLLKTLEEGLFMPVDNYTGVDKYINLFGIWPRCIHVDISLESNINIERQAYKKPKGTENLKESRKNKIKNSLERLGFLKYIQSLNGGRIKIQRELKHFPQQIKIPKKYLIPERKDK